VHGMGATQWVSRSFPSCLWTLNPILTVIIPQSIQARSVAQYLSQSIQAKLSSICGPVCHLSSICGPVCHLSSICGPVCLPQSIQTHLSSICGPVCLPQSISARSVVLLRSPTILLELRWRSPTDRWSCVGKLQRAVGKLQRAVGVLLEFSNTIGGISEKKNML